jgi:hypothetical protein
MADKSSTTGSSSAQSAAQLASDVASALLASSRAKGKSTDNTAAHVSGGGDDGGDSGDDFDEYEDDVNMSSDAPISLAGLQYAPTQESVMPKHEAEELFNRHFAKMKDDKKYDLSNGVQKMYLFAILFDMAINGSSEKRSGDNYLLFNGKRLPTSYLDDIGKGAKLRRFGRQYYGMFMNTMLQDTPEARDLRVKLAARWGCSSAMAVYVVDFVDTTKVKNAHKLFARNVVEVRTRGGEAAALRYFAEQRRTAYNAAGGHGGELQPPHDQHNSPGAWF